VLSNKQGDHRICVIAVHVRDQVSRVVIARLPGSAQVKTGETLHFAITPGEVHLFDRDTGRRV
jgi:ABC-type sugar transport system ATPase subunit